MNSKYESAGILLFTKIGKLKGSELLTSIFLSAAYIANLSWREIFTNLFIFDEEFLFL